MSKSTYTNTSNWNFTRKDVKGFENYINNLTPKEKKDMKKRVINRTKKHISRVFIAPISYETLNKPMDF